MGTVNKPKSTIKAKKETNTTYGSVASIPHGEPEIWLYGRVAAGVVGYVTNLGQGRTSLHLTIMIFDDYEGVWGVDGQPTTSGKLKMIRSNFYSSIPSGVKVRIILTPPQGMSKQQYAQEIKKNAHNFASYTVPYSVPRKLYGETMLDGEYNSGSYVSGLLQSIHGSARRAVSFVTADGYVAPGWEEPIPSYYFKGEAFK